MKPLLIGEKFGGKGGEFPLSPNPPRGSGGRLAKILGLDPETYVKTFDAVNLCAGEWDKTEARETAHANRKRTPVILLGKRVARAFGFKFAPFTSPAPGVVILPHPSGRNLLWNETGSVQKARDIVKSVCQ